ncbi:MAG: Holliday junction branch migration protein RuvA [Deltaproteobacteria bacterium]|nr:Holliday junction branch migration protein RuvA [Deltaproteobacteria bacterium]
MIARLTGRVLEKGPGRLVLDVAGVGYDLLLPASTVQKLPDDGAQVRLFVRTVVREDAITLFGFLDRRERDLFDMLVTVKNVGPRVAIAILSGMPFEPLVVAMLEEDYKTLTAIPGLGRKTAERILVELKDKIALFAQSVALEHAADVPQSAQDALSALVNLGYTRVEAARAVSAAVKDLGAGAALEQIVAKSLNILGN